MSCCRTGLGEWMIGDIAFVIRNGLRWRDALREHGQTAVLYRGDLEAEALDLADELDIDLDRVEAHPDEQIINGTANYEILLLLGVDWATATNLGDDIPLE